MLSASLVCALALAACKQENANYDYDKENSQTHTTGANVPADNTKMNERDRSGTSLLPRDQSNTTADIELTARIRKALVADKNLSMDAKNVKIITRDGNVVLRGAVKDDAEKKGVEGEAHKIQGVKNVDNQLNLETR